MTTSSIKSPSTKMSTTQRHQGPSKWRVSCMTTDVACLFSSTGSGDFPCFFMGSKEACNQVMAQKCTTCFPSMLVLWDWQGSYTWAFLELC